MIQFTMNYRQNAIVWFVDCEYFAISEFSLVWQPNAHSQIDLHRPGTFAHIHRHLHILSPFHLHIGRKAARSK